MSSMTQSRTPSKKHICGTCGRGFGSKSAQRNHFRDKHSRTNNDQAVTSTNEPAASGHASSLIHRGITYSTLSTVEKISIKGGLQDFCHSEQLLLNERYPLPTSSTSENRSGSRPEAFLPCPDRNSLSPKATAVVLDCEMAGNIDQQEELVQITAIDFLTGNTMLNCLVDPSKPISDWREGITGISASTMRHAVAIGEALHGWEAARAELWRVVDKETIIVGQSIYNDLRALHVAHFRIIDSAIVTAEAVFGCNSKIRKMWGLETLCRELLGIQIRKPSQSSGCKIHDALEDALAARELVLCCVRKPQDLRLWAQEKKKTFFMNGKRQTGNSQPRRLPTHDKVGTEDMETTMSRLVATDL